jgi:D-aspartate ligase
VEAMPNKEPREQSIAIVMNMFCTGLGIARSLGEEGVPVIGLSSHRGACGNFSRHAQVRSAPDSREQPEQLLRFLLDLGRDVRSRCVIFPTRDDDVLFLAQYREQLQPLFDLVLPGASALEASLDKWETSRAAQAAGVPGPRSWSIHSKIELLAAAAEFRFPCVLKPVSAHHWRKQDNWQLVGNRKAIGVTSMKELTAEYDKIAGSESRALIQEMIPGGDECLWIAACYLNRQSRFVAGFAAQKLLQVPAGFGTGCMVQTVDRPDLVQIAAAFLEKIGFSGIAEVEFKRDAASGEYKLIEINPRPWDQHRLGKACGVDLIHIAYCDLAGLPLPAVNAQSAGERWIAEDVFWWLLLRSLYKREGRFLALLRLARGRRVYSMWSLRDPLPSLGFFATSFVPELVVTLVRYLRSRISGRFSSRSELPYENC